MDEASMCDKIALIQEGTLLSVETPKAMTESFSEDLWSIRSPKLHKTSLLLEKLPSLISVNSFGQVLHLVTSKGEHNSKSIGQFLLQNNDIDSSVEPVEATIEDVFILLMNPHKQNSQ